MSIPTEGRPAPEELLEAGELGDAEAEGEARRGVSRHQRQQRKIARLEAELAAHKAGGNGAARAAARPAPGPASRPARAAAPERTRTLNQILGPAPDPRRFPDRAAFEAAYLAWDRGRREMLKTIGQRLLSESRRKATDERQALARIYQERQRVARDELPDYDDVVLAARLPVTPAVERALVESDITGRLEYHLAKNPEKLAELNRMSPSQAARAIGRLEELLSRSAPAPTQAPAPMTRLNGGGASPRRALGDLPMEEYAAARQAGRTT